MNDSIETSDLSCRPFTVIWCGLRVTFDGEESMQLTLMDTSDETEGSKEGPFSSLLLRYSRFHSLTLSRYTVCGSCVMSWKCCWF